MDGYEATRYVRNVLGDVQLKIIALTANNTNQARVRCMEAGMDDYFTKPITIKAISEMLHKWLPTTGKLFH